MEPTPAVAAVAVVIGRAPVDERVQVPAMLGATLVDVGLVLLGCQRFQLGAGEPLRVTGIGGRWRLVDLALPTPVVVVEPGLGGAGDG